MRDGNCHHPVGLSPQRTQSYADGCLCCSEGMREVVARCWVQAVLVPLACIVCLQIDFAHLCLHIDFAHRFFERALQGFHQLSAVVGCLSLEWCRQVFCLDEHHAFTPATRCPFARITAAAAVNPALLQLHSASPLLHHGEASHSYPNPYGAEVAL